MKSTASAALASLQHKFKAKIVEVGKLKNELKAARFGKATEGSQLLADQAKQLTRVVFDLQSALAQEQHFGHAAERKLVDVRSSAENFKSLCVIMCIVGVVVGGLSHYAYTLNVAV